MRILVTGASRGAGRSIVDALKAAGHDVTGMVRKDEDAERLRSSGVGAVLGDLTDPSGLAKVCAGNEALVHAAAAVGEDHDGGVTFNRINVDGTRALFEAAAKGGVHSAVLVS